MIAKGRLFLPEPVWYLMGCPNFSLIPGSQFTYRDIVDAILSWGEIMKNVDVRLERTKTEHSADSTDVYDLISWFANLLSKAIKRLKLELRES
jgi:hypothetical protein